ncbi:MAG: DoxX family membrane protein [Patescibacteria group bacterium]
MTTASWLLRIGLALMFAYAAVGSFLQPDSWVGYFPLWMRGLVPENVLLSGFSIVEIGVALWLLSGRALKWASLVSVAMLSGIVIFNLSLFDVIFRDVGLVFAALALFFLSKKS